VRLYGPGKERQRKLDWYAREGLCPECYRAQRHSEQDAAGPQVYLRATQREEAKPLLAEIIVTYSYHVRAELRQRGYQYGEFYGLPDPTRRPQNDIVRILTSPGQHGWVRRINPLHAHDDLAAEMDWLHSMGWAIHVIHPSSMSQVLGALGEGDPSLVGPMDTDATLRSWVEQIRLTRPRNEDGIYE
jgi:hypothetical protein